MVSKEMTLKKGQEFVTFVNMGIKGMSKTKTRCYELCPQVGIGDSGLNLLPFKENEDQ